MKRRRGGRKKGGILYPALGPEMAGGNPSGAEPVRKTLYPGLEIGKKKKTNPWCGGWKGGNRALFLNER